MSNKRGTFMPGFIAALPDDDAPYTVTQDGDIVTVIDPKTGEVVAVINTSTGAAESAKYRAVLVGDTVTVSSKATGEVVGTGVVGKGPTSAMLSIPSACCMLPGDYLVSDNGVFIAVVLADGTFAVYRGTDPSNTAGAPLWKSLAGSVTCPEYIFTTRVYNWPAPKAPCYFALVGACSVISGQPATVLDLSYFDANPTNLVGHKVLIDTSYHMEGVVQGATYTYDTCWSVPLQFNDVSSFAEVLLFDSKIPAAYWKISNVGQLEIHAGTDPTDPASRLLVAYGPKDAVTSCTITAISYDTSIATFKPSGTGFKTIALGNLQTNDSASASNAVTFSGSTTVGYSSGWSNSFSTTEGSSTEISAGVSTSELPFVDVEGSVSVATYKEFTNTTELNGTQEWSMTLGYDLTFTVPPYTVMRGMAQITNGTLTVPFTLTGEFVFASDGAKLKATGHGVYVGNNCINDAVFTVDVGYSTAQLTIDASADYRASFCLKIVSPTNGSVIYTSPSSRELGPGESGSINLEDYALGNNCFFVGGAQTSMYPVLTLSDGTTVNGGKIPVYKPSPGNDHFAVYDCAGNATRPACVFNADQSG